MTEASLLAARAAAVDVVAMLDALLKAPVPPTLPQPIIVVTPAPPVVAPTDVGLSTPAAFFAHLKTTKVLGPELIQAEVDGCNAVLDAGAGILPLAWCAYALATSWWETGGEMAPNVENLNYTTAARIRAVWPSRFPTTASAEPYVRNARALANKVYNATIDAKGNIVPRMGNRPNSDDGWNYRGRGQSHLTGLDNYIRADRELGLSGAMVADPDLALRPDLAARILVLGMRDGWFTGKRFNDYIPAKAEASHFSAARRIINPDRNGDAVAAGALVFRDALVAGGWR